MLKLLELLEISPPQGFWKYIFTIQILVQSRLKHDRKWRFHILAPFAVRPCDITVVPNAVLWQLFLKMLCVTRTLAREEESIFLRLVIDSYIKFTIPRKQQMKVGLQKNTENAAAPLLSFLKRRWQMLWCLYSFTVESLVFTYLPKQCKWRVEWHVRHLKGYPWTKSIDFHSYFSNKMLFFYY